MIREYDDEFRKYYFAQKEASHSIELKYVDENNYNLIKEIVKISGTKFTRKNKQYLPNASRNVCDYFCRLIIYSYAEQAELLTPASLYKTKASDTNRRSKSAKGLITSGRYTNWKAPFMESGFSNTLGVSAKEFQVSGVVELLDYPAICILLLYEYFLKEYNDEDAISKISKRNDLWKRIEKILKAYHANEKKTVLHNIEKYDIFSSITGGSLNLGKLSYLYGRKRIRTKNSEIDDNMKQELLDELRKAGKDLYSKYELGEEKELILEEGSNYDGRQFKFAPYLAPIVAAICEYFSEEKDFEELQLWRKKKTYKKLERDLFCPDCTEETLTELSKNCSELLDYIKSTKGFHNIYKDAEFLEKYYYITGLMLHKINCTENKVLNNDHKVIQYYVVEYLMKMELIEKETEIIYKKIKEIIEKKDSSTDEKKSKAILKRFLKKNKFLKHALNIFNNFEGVFTRIGLAEQTIQKYFDRDIRKKGNRMKSKERTLQTIRYEAFLYHIHQQLFLESMFMGKTDMSGKRNVITRGELLNTKIILCGESAGKSYLEQTKTFLNKSIELSRTLIDKKQVKSFVKEKIEGLDFLEREILIWVISRNFNNAYPSKIYANYERNTENIEEEIF